MKTEMYFYSVLTNMTVGMHCQKERNLRMMRGKVLLNQAENKLLFVQNNPRGARSREVMRTVHSRLVITPRGGCTLTFRFRPEEKGLARALEGEMRYIIKKELTNLIERKEQEV